MQIKSCGSAPIGLNHHGPCEDHGGAAIVGQTSADRLVALMVSEALALVDRLACGQAA